LVRADEPLKWQPPFEWLKRCTMPINGCQPEDVLEEMVEESLEVLPAVTDDAHDVRFRCLRICCIRSGVVGPISPR